MYSVFKGEYVKKGFTLEKICEELQKRGYKTTVSHLSQNLNGKFGISLKMAKDLKDIIGSDLTIEELFEIKEAG
jgi:hypothetical protein